MFPVVEGPYLLNPQSMDTLPEGCRLTIIALLESFSSLGLRC
jgi:hypothetical protein